MTNLANELQTLTVEIKQSLDEVKDNVEREGSEIRGDIKHGEEEMGKVCLYTEKGRSITSHSKYLLLPFVILSIGIFPTWNNTM